MKRFIGLVTITVLLTISFSACGNNEATSAVTSSEQPGSADSDSEYIEKYGNEIMATAKSSLDGYINGYKISLDPKAWTVARYDDNNTVMAVSEITYHGSTGPFYYVGTLELDDAGKVISATHHYIEADGAVLLDDGYCEDAAETVQSITGK